MLRGEGLGRGAAGGCHPGPVIKYHEATAEAGRFSACGVLN